jgi:hypothetical protein
MTDWVRSSAILALCALAALGSASSAWAATLTVGQPYVWTEVQEVPVSGWAGIPGAQVIALFLDGLALDVHGSVYVAVPSRFAVVRINTEDLTQETIAYSIQIRTRRISPLLISRTAWRSARGRVDVKICLSAIWE